MFTSELENANMKIIDSTLLHLNKGTYDRMLFD